MEVDRTKVCPLLLRCFWKLNRGYPLAAYRDTSKDIYPSQEIQIYSWRDASLKEISDLVKDVVPAAQESGSILSFSLVFVNKSGSFDIKQIGRIFSLRTSPDDEKTLNDVGFVTGDFLDIAILPARGNNGAVTSSSNTNDRIVNRGDNRHDRNNNTNNNNSSNTSNSNHNNHNNSNSNKKIRLH